MKKLFFIGLIIIFLTGCAQKEAIKQKQISKTYFSKQIDHWISNINGYKHYSTDRYGEFKRDDIYFYKNKKNHNYFISLHKRKITGFWSAQNAMGGIFISPDLSEHITYKVISLDELHKNWKRTKLINLNHKWRFNDCCFSKSIIGNTGIENMPILGVYFHAYNATNIKLEAYYLNSLNMNDVVTFLDSFNNRRNKKFWPISSIEQIKLLRNSYSKTPSIPYIPLYAKKLFITDEYKRIRKNKQALLKFYKNTNNKILKGLAKVDLFNLKYNCPDYISSLGYFADLYQESNNNHPLKTYISKIWKYNGGGFVYNYYSVPPMCKIRDGLIAKKHGSYSENSIVSAAGSLPINEDSIKFLKDLKKKISSPKYVKKLNMAIKNIENKISQKSLKKYIRKHLSNYFPNNCTNGVLAWKGQIKNNMPTGKGKLLCETYIDNYAFGVYGIDTTIDNNGDIQRKGILQSQLYKRGWFGHSTNLYKSSYNSKREITELLADTMEKAKKEWIDWKYSSTTETSSTEKTVSIESNCHNNTCAVNTNNSYYDSITYKYNSSGTYKGCYTFYGLGFSYYCPNYFDSSKRLKGECGKTSAYSLHNAMEKIANCKVNGHY